MDIELKLTINEVNTLLGVLGELPIKTGLHPIAVKIKEQAEVQVQKGEEA